MPRRAVALAAAAWAALAVVPVSPIATAGASGDSAGPPRGPAVEARPLRGFRAEIATLIVQGVEGGALPFAALALPERAEAAGGGLVRVPFVVEVPGAPLLAAGAAASGLTLEVYLYAIDGEGAVAAHLARAVELDLEALGEALFETGVKLADEFAVPAGTFALRFVVFEPASRRFGMRIEPLTVGRQGLAGLAGPRWAETCPSWVAAGKAAEGLALPAARPVLVAGERAAAAAWTARQGAVARLAATLAPRTAAGRPGAGGAPAAPREPVEVELVSGPHGPLGLGRGGPARLELALRVPEIPQGIYELRLDDGGASEAAPPQEVWVVTEAALGAESAGGIEPARDRRAGCGLAWSGILRRASGGSERAEAVLAAAPEASAPSRGQLQRVRVAYRGVLETLGVSGDLAAAAAELGRVEEGLAGAGPRGLAALRRGQLEEAQALAEREGASALPLLLLHEETYAEHFRQRRFALATHSREMVSDFAEWLGQRRGAGREPAMLADVLTSLAEHADRHRMFMLGQLLLERAVELDPERRAARLLLAISYERLGRYDGAVAQLERLVALDARNQEARLRLAVLLERTGRGAEAEGILRRLVRERPDDWVLSLAVQTLARRLADGGRPGEAAAVLERGISRLPRDQRLHLQLAWTLDRAGRPREVAAVLARLPIGAEASGPSPRFHYAESSASALAPVREALARGMTARLPLLARALQGEGGRGPAP